jgi:hypothetical protein
VGARKKAPLCERVSLLAVLELAQHDALRAPLVLPAETDVDSALERQRLEATRRHLEQERCPICRRWYRNALAAAGVALDADAEQHDAS